MAFLCTLSGEASGFPVGSFSVSAVRVGLGFRV